MHWMNRILIALMVSAAVAYLPRSLVDATAADDLVRIEREREELVAANAALREQIELIRAEVEALGRDRDEIARIAREDLNLAGPDEIVFELVHPATATETVTEHP